MLDRNKNRSEIVGKPIREAIDYDITRVTTDNLLRKPTRLNGYQFAFCLSGSISLNFSGENVQYTKNSFTSFSPFNTLDVTDVSDDFSCVMMMFQKGFLLETLNNIYFLERFQILRNQGVSHIQLEENEMELFEAKLKRIAKKTNQNTHHFKRDIIRSELIILLYELENIFLNQNQEIKYTKRHKGKEKKLSNFQHLLIKHFYKERKVSFYADLLHTSPAHLSRLLVETTGKTAKIHIDEMRLLQAKHLLKMGKYNISEVASMLYYDNIEEFSRFFKKKTTLTPSKYLKS